MNKKRLFKARDGFTLREVAGENILIPVNTGGIKAIDKDERLPEFNGMIQLNDTGVFLWKALQQPKTLGGLIDEACQTFNVEESVVENDIIEFLNMGIQNQIIFFSDSLIEQ